MIYEEGGKRSPVDTASAIAGVYVILYILYNNINNDRMMITVLSSKWLVDSLIDNAVTVKTGNKTLEFIQLGVRESKREGQVYTLDKKSFLSLYL